MSQISPNSFERADVFHYFDAERSAATSASDSNQGNGTITEVHYAALVQMVASKLGLTSDDAKRLFPSFKTTEDAADKKTQMPTTAPDAMCISSVREPPLCSHLSREGVELYWSNPSANFIPDVRCCDAREMDKQEPFPVTGHGPHVHCLYCFHTAIENTPPPERGALPPVVADFRDACTLQAHQRNHHDRYLIYLKLLEDCSNGNAELNADILSNEGKAACESAAEQESRHGCYMAAMGSTACPIVVFYCAECDCFAPLVRFERACEVVDEDIRTETQHEDLRKQKTLSDWVSTEELSVILSRLLLSCHLLFMMDLNRFAGALKHTHLAGSGETSEATPPRHIIYLFKPVLFHEGVEEEVIESFEEGAECTHVAAVLPYASVAGDPAELFVLKKKEGEKKCGVDTCETDNTTSSTFSPAVIGFAIEWASQELLQAKLDLVLHQHQLGTTMVPFHVTRRWVYIEDTQEWVQAHVLYHRMVATLAELPSAYADPEDEGIRVVDTYTTDAPLPDNTSNAAASLPSTAISSPCSETIQPPSDAEEEEDQLAPDSCPYSMESRTVDFFVRMTALAKAMHELATWRLSTAENKDAFPSTKECGGHKLVT